MMVRESPVHFGEEQMVFARKLLDQQFERGAGGAVARVPADLEPGEAGAVDPGQALDQPLDIGVQDLAVLMAPLPSSQSPAAAMRAQLAGYPRRRTAGPEIPS